MLKEKMGDTIPSPTPSDRSTWRLFVSASSPRMKVHEFIVHCLRVMLRMGGVLVVTFFVSTQFSAERIEALLVHCLKCKILPLIMYFWGECLTVGGQ